MSSVTQYDDNKSSDVLLPIWDCDKVDRRGAKENKELWYCGYCVNDYNIWNHIKALVQLTISGGRRTSRCRGEILSKYQRKFKALKENKYFLRNQRVQKRDLLQKLVHSDAEAI